MFLANMNVSISMRVGKSIVLEKGKGEDGEGPLRLILSREPLTPSAVQISLIASKTFLRTKTQKRVLGATNVAYETPGRA